MLQEKEKAEAALMAQTQMDWVVIRPGGLTNDPATGNGGRFLGFMVQKTLQETEI